MNPYLRMYVFAVPCTESVLNVYIDVCMCVYGTLAHMHTYRHTHTQHTYVCMHIFCRNK